MCRQQPTSYPGSFHYVSEMSLGTRLDRNLILKRFNLSTYYYLHILLAEVLELAWLFPSKICNFKFIVNLFSVSSFDTRVILIFKQPRPGGRFL